MNIFYMLLHLAHQSDFFTKIIIYTLLFVAFFISGLFIYNYFKIKKKLALLEQAQELLSKKNISYPELKKSSNHFVHYICTLEFPKEFSSDDIQEALYFLTTQYIAREKRSLYIFNISAAASPLIGLLGTVWGIIHAFMGIAQSGAGDLSAVAPGIAEALITTLAGLFVAIPALYYYHNINASYKNFLHIAGFIILFISIGMTHHEK